MASANALVNSEANARRIAFVEQCFGASGQPLAVPGRVLVGEGVLTKMCRKKPKPRQFFLFNDILVYGNIMISKKKYNKQHIIPLEDVKIETVDDDGHLRNGWKIISPSKSFVVFAATATEKAEWMAHINKCVQTLIQNQTIPRGVKEDSPVWVPDNEAAICMQCHKTEFTVINRRHHCRKCGKVVCNGCSAKRFLLPQQSSKPLRVCATCFETLSAGSNKQTEKKIGWQLCDLTKHARYKLETYATCWQYYDVQGQAQPEDSSGEDSSDEDDDVTPADNGTQGEVLFYG